MLDIVKRLGILVLVTIGAGLGMTGIAEAAVNDGKVRIETNVRRTLQLNWNAVTMVQNLCPGEEWRFRAQDAVFYADRTGYTTYACYSREGRVRIVGAA